MSVAGEDERAVRGEHGVLEQAEVSVGRRDEVMNWDNDEELLDCEKREALVRRTTLLRNHVAKHRAILLAQGTDPAALETAKMEQSLSEFLESEAAVAAAEEVMLQAAAQKAESDLALAVSQLVLLEKMESIPQEQLDAASEESRAQFLSARQELHENREALLGELPIELRREWEERLRPE
ncbi:MAG TPA: hypothetical protein VGO11_02930 [Chthoniobacteraceae bacterium]|nr:hypothetical protein [Chthoniobacteraceae bacterium]